MDGRPGSASEDARLGQCSALSPERRRLVVGGMELVCELAGAPVWSRWATSVPASASASRPASSFQLVCSVPEMADGLLHFRPAHTLGAGIARAFKEERAEILSLLPHAEVLHTGATSVQRR